MVTVESPEKDEEYVLFIGGMNDQKKTLQNVFKYNGTWSLFGQLNKYRGLHSSIYWNGAVFVIGGGFSRSNSNAKMEIWNIKDSPDQFKTKENWPLLIEWDDPFLFIVPDSLFPDY